MKRDNWQPISKREWQDVQTTGLDHRTSGESNEGIKRRERQQKNHGKRECNEQEKYNIYNMHNNISCLPCVLDKGKQLDQDIRVSK